MLEAVKHLKVLVVGDAIIDEYVYVLPLGKSTKDNMLSVAYQKKESFRGGVWAAAAHVRAFCDEVDVMVGESITINRRYVEEAYLRKLFVIHETRRIENPPKITDMGAYDLVIVTDFGHGCITFGVMESLQQAKFLAVNAQTNTSNYGFNMITKYAKADFVVLDELEARLATHDRDSPIQEIIRKLGYRRIIVTQGYKGATGYDGEFHYSPAPVTQALDTMGAGDAFLCVSALFACVGFPMKELVRIGNAAGAAKVNIIGHRQSVTPELVSRYL